MRTFDQAVSAALEAHDEKYPGAAVYAVSVSETPSGYAVEARANHFSTSLLYEVAKNECPSEACLTLRKLVESKAAQCKEQVLAELWPASTTPKRQAATKRLVAVLEVLEAAAHELNEALGDIEDAV